MQIDVGRVIAGKYRLVRLIGRGSMGEVWAAHHQTLNEHVALKLLMPSPPDAGDEEAIESSATATARFRFEAQLAAKLSRKTRHIARVTDHGEEDGLAYLVMELLEGETLDALLDRDRRIALPTLSNMVGQIGRALTQAHTEGVAHRDLKPANVFLTRDEDGKLLVKLLDFGIARAIHAHRMPPSSFATAKGLVFGTPSYMSPEQARGSAKLDHRCDLWALATIAYEGATGDLPVDGQETDELLKNLCAGRIVRAGERQPDLGNSLDAFFDKALAESMADRFQSAAELAAAFARAVGAPPEREVSLPSLDTVAGPADDDDDLEDVQPMLLVRRTRARRAVLATGAVLVAGVALGVAWRALAHPPEVAVTPGVSAPPPSAVASTLPPPVVIPADTAISPAVAVSNLPRVPLRPYGGPPAPAPQPASPTPTTAAPPVTPAPAAPPAPAPTPAPTTKKDRSEVF